jgi:hypothetical protein
MRVSTRGTNVRGLYQVPFDDPGEYETEYRFVLNETDETTDTTASIEDSG